MCAQSYPTLQPHGLACQASLSMEFSRQEYWSGLPLPSLGNLPNPGIKPKPSVSPALAGRFFTTVLPGKPQTVKWMLPVEDRREKRQKESGQLTVEPELPH